jgi:hypothetical protein
VAEAVGATLSDGVPAELPAGVEPAGAVAESVTLGTVPDKLGEVLLVEAGEFLLMMSRICCS